MGKASLNELKLIGLRFSVRIAASLAQAAFLILLARLLGPNRFGTFAITLAVFSIAGVFLGLGASTRMLRISAEEDQNRITFSLVVIRLISIACLLVAGLLASLYIDDYEVLFLALFFVAGDQLFDFAVAACSGLQKHLIASGLIILQRSIPLATFGVIDRLEVGQVSLILVPSLTIAVFTCAVIGVRTAASRFDATVIRSSVPYWNATLATSLNQVEPVALGFVVSPYALATYSLGSRLSQPLTIFVSALQVIFLPRLAAATGPAEFRAVLKRVRIAAALYAGVLILMSPLIVLLAQQLLGTAYNDSSMVFYAFVIGAALSSYSQTFQMRYLAEGNPRASTNVIAGGTVTGTLLVLGVVLIFSDELIWLAPLLTQSIILGGLLIVARRHPL